MVLLFNERAQQSNGNLDRGSLLWDLITTSDGRPIYKYYIRDENQVVGYINYQQSSYGGTRNKPKIIYRLDGKSFKYFRCFRTERLSCRS